MHILGVIPAAGKGSRWGGYLKELLPCGDGEFLLGRTVKAMVNGGADAVLIVTRPEKVAAHMGHMAGYTDVPVYYAMQQGNNDIWSAIQESFGFPADRYYFAMPDTYFTPASFYWHGEATENFVLGVFKTTRPERFGVFHNGRIVNKSEKLHGEHTAWGNLAWSADVVRTWQMEQPEDYTRAINIAMQTYSYGLVSLDEYHDMATAGDYFNFMIDRHIEYIESMP